MRKKKDIQVKRRRKIETLDQSFLMFFLRLTSNVIKLKAYAVTKFGCQS